MTDITRRKFIQLSVIGSAVAATGCENFSRYPPGVYGSEWRGQYGGYNDRIHPYVNQPEGLQTGVPQYFATTCRMCPAGCGIYVRTMGGRALKVEGNPAHPVSGGKTCSRGQSAVQHLYNPGRLRRPKQRTSRTEALAEIGDWNAVLTRAAQSFAAANGRKLIVADAMELQTSPHKTAAVTAFARAVNAEIVSYTLLDDLPWRTAAATAYGRNQVPYYALDQADCIISFHGNFLEAWPSPVLYNRLFGEFRQGPRRTQGEHGRYYYVGPRMSMTAAKADRWIPCDAGQEMAVVNAISAALTNPAGAQAAGGVPANRIAEMAQAFAAAGARAVALGGDGLLGHPNATEAFTAVERLNQQVGSRCVGFGTAALASAQPSRSGFAAMQDAIASMNAGAVGALMYIGQSNPVFTLPASTGIAAALSHVPFVVALTPFEDETTGFADIVLPTRTFLEEWSDSVPLVVPAGASVASLLQPVIDPGFVIGNGVSTNFVVNQANPDPADQQIAPWMDTRPLGDLLADLAHRINGATFATGENAVRTAWAPIAHTHPAMAPSADTAWSTALATGGVWTSGGTATASRTTAGTAGAPAAATTSSTAATAPVAPPPPEPGTVALVVYPHIFWTDGRHANLPWLQENPSPMTSAVWNSWIEINMEAARSRGIHTGDIIRLTSAHGSIEAPAFVSPAIHPDVVAMPIGQGHEGGHYGATANEHGANPLAIIDPAGDTATGALAYSATRVKLEKVRDARPMDLVLLQDIPGGQEPDEVKDLIHTTAREWRQSRPVAGSPSGKQNYFQGASENNESPTANQ